MQEMRADVDPEDALLKLGMDYLNLHL